MRGFVRGWAPLGVYALLMAVLSLLPVSGGISGRWDKLYHAAAYFAMAWFCMSALYLTGRASGLAAGLYAFTFSFAFGGAMEFLQGLTGTRTAEFFDALANGAGAAAGSLSYLYVKSVRR